MLRLLLNLAVTAALGAGTLTAAWAQGRDDGDAAWQRLTPEQKIEAWRRLSPEQRQAIRQRLTPEQRDAIRQRMQERRESGEFQGRRLSPEERQQLRDQIRESNRTRPPRPDKRGR